MYERLKRLYVTGKLTAIGLANAVIKGWITEVQKQEIMDMKQQPCRTKRRAQEIVQKILK